MGSVPFIKGERTAESIFQIWDLPFWPQYPSRSLRENFIFQFLSTFPGLKVTDTGASFDEQAYLQQETGVNLRLKEAFRKEEFLSFEPSPDWALGYAEMKGLLDQETSLQKRWIKLQVTGPGTVWSSFFSKQIKGSLVPQIRAHLAQILTVSGLAQIQRIYLHGRNPLIVVDDPFFWDDIPGLQEMLSAFKRTGAKAGLHFCSSPTRLDILKELELDLVHFDLSLWSGTSPESLFLDQWLKQGKWIAWGIISTSPDTNFLSSDFSLLLLKHLEGIRKLGWSLEEIFRHSLLAPACGTGSLTPETDRKVTQCLLQTVNGLKNSYFPC